MKKLLLISSLAILVLLTGCFATKTRLSTIVNLGMTSEQVIEKCGTPYKKSAKYDAKNNLQEILYYLSLIHI